MSEPNFSQLEIDLVRSYKYACEQLTLLRQYAESLEAAAAITPRELSNLRADLAAANRQIEQLSLDLSRATGAAGGASARADAADRECNDLRRAYALERQRAEAAEAALAAVPRAALWRLYNDFPYANISEAFGADFATAFEEIFEWLKAQPEVQP